jgi:hypothetical protein
MPEDLLDDDLGDDRPDDSAVVKQLRARAKAAAAENRELREQTEAGKAAQRELMFARAGVPIDDPKNGYFVRGYDGELTASSIKAAYQEFNGGVAVEADPTLATDAAAMDRISGASQGAVNSPIAEPGDRTKMMEEINTLTAGKRDSMEIEKIAKEVMRQHGVQFAD